MTVEEAGYKETNTNFDYFAAGNRCSNYNQSTADANFDSLAIQYGVQSGPYGSWDQFWMGYYG